MRERLRLFSVGEEGEDVMPRRQARFCRDFTVREAVRSTERPRSTRDPARPKPTGTRRCGFHDPRVFDTS